MDETNVQEASDEALQLLSVYVRERIQPHPLLNPVLPDAAVMVTGSVAAGTWDEHSDLDLRMILPDEEHVRLSTQLQEAGLWDAERDHRLFLEDHEPFRRFPGAELAILSTSQLEQEFRFQLPTALWIYTHAAVLQDPLNTLGAAVAQHTEEFHARLNQLQCEHYFRFRQARNDLIPRIMPRRQTTVLSIKRGEAVREALRLAFLADGKPYPHDKWLEVIAERETRCGSGIVAAVRALISAREQHTIEHASKVLRDRVAFALQQGGVREKWLEQWWTWPSIAP